jgi:Kef-type K+ transport system membrane component KefB
MSIPLLLGILFLIGLGADLLGRSTFLPRVTLLLVGGVAAGPAGFGLLPAAFIGQWFAPMTNIALALIGFLLGHQLSLPALRRRGRKVIGITLCKVFGAWTAVTLVLLAAGVDPVVAILLAGLAPATDPAATFDIVHESDAGGEFVATLLSVVSLDDVVGLLLFVAMVALAGALTGEAGAAAAVTEGIVELGGSALLGVILGMPMAWLTGRIRPGETTLAEGLGFVLLCSGLAEWFDLMPILSAIVMGITVASTARHGKRLFDAIEGVEWPFMILFFVLAGASLDVATLLAAGAVTIIYMSARFLGIYTGARAGCVLVGLPGKMQRWLGIALLPQAGVAIGMALLAAQRFPEIAPLVLTVAVASTIVLETIGPVFARMALRAAATP